MMKKFLAVPAAEQQRVGGLPPIENFKAQAEEGGLYGFFGARGLPKAQADACLSNQKVIDQLNAWTQKYADDGINSTPSFVINGTLWEYSTTSDLWPQLDQALTRATGG
jgi:2-hydroxychromene-2-carboxylate isomerase